MPTYPTPGPVDLAVDLQVGALEVVAGDRSDTVVTVSPTNPDKAVDRRGAEETVVAFDGRRLTVTGPRPRLAWMGPNESVDVRVELPAGSRLSAELAVGNVRTSGRLGATRVKASTAGTVEGGAEITADHGQVRIGRVSGEALVRTSHGTVTVGEAGGDLEAKLSYGDLEITRALASVRARTAYGSIALREVSSGSVELESGYGQVVVGVRPGVPAWLDLSSKDGRVRNELAGDSAPDPAEPTVAVRARAQHGDITVERAR